MTVTKKPRTDVSIRWMIRRDMADILRIENEGFRRPWTEEDFRSCLRRKDCIGMVAEHDHEVVGFVIYELHPSKINVLSVAVASESRRRQVGTQIVQKLIGKLSQRRRNEIILGVPETNLSAQLFWRAQGFEAVSVARGAYDGTGEDVYVMCYRLDESPAFAGRNKISDLCN